MFVGSLQGVITRCNGGQGGQHDIELTMMVEIIIMDECE